MADQTVKIGKTVESQQDNKSSVKTGNMGKIEGVPDNDGILQKDMKLTAAEVIDEILNTDNDVAITIDGIRINGKSYIGINAITYLKEYDASAVFNDGNFPFMLVVGRSYNRVYMQNASGAITGISYKREG